MPTLKSITVFLALTLVACHDDEPRAGGRTLSHWEHEARQVSFLSFWNSTKDERRHVAFRRLVEIGEPAVPSLVKLLRHEGIPVSGDALNALAQLGPRASAAVPELIAMLSDQEPVHRVDAAIVLGSIGSAAEPAVPQLTVLLQTGNAQQARIAAQALAQIGGAGRAALDAAALSSNPVVRQAGVSGATAAPRDSAEIRRVVTRALADTTATVRAQGVGLLMYAAPQDLVGLSDLLMRAFQDPSDTVRAAARGVFTSHRQHSGRREILLAVLEGGDAESRADAAWGLALALEHPIERAQMTDAGRVVDALRGATRDVDQRVRVYAAKGLGAGSAVDLPRAISVLRIEIPRAPVDLQIRGASALWTFTHDVDDVRSAFENGYRDRNRWMRLEALSETFKLGKAAQALAPAIQQLQSDPDREVAERARRVLDGITRAR